VGSIAAVRSTTLPGAARSRDDCRKMSDGDQGAGWRRLRAGTGQDTGRHCRPVLGLPDRRGAARGARSGAGRCRHRRAGRAAAAAAGADPARPARRRRPPNRSAPRCARKLTALLAPCEAGAGVAGAATLRIDGRRRQRQRQDHDDRQALRIGSQPEATRCCWAGGRYVSMAVVILGGPADFDAAESRLVLPTLALRFRPIRNGTGAMIRRRTRDRFDPIPYQFVGSAARRESRLPS